MVWHARSVLPLSDIYQRAGDRAAGSVPQDGFFFMAFCKSVGTDESAWQVRAQPTNMRWR